jgi:hypothetical protein
MTAPPVFNLHGFGPRAQMMAMNCSSERLAMTLQYVAIGSMIILAGASVAQFMKELFGHSEHHGRSK